MKDEQIQRSNERAKRREFAARLARIADVWEQRAAKWQHTLAGDAIQHCAAELREVLKAR